MNQKQYKTFNLLNLIFKLVKNMIKKYLGLGIRVFVKRPDPKI